MNRYDATPVLSGLKQFQRNTVTHVMDRYFGEQPTRRFLVADETGLGKSVVARGVIASMMEKLQDDDSVKRIDVIYVCSNTDIAAQNLKRLNVLGDDQATMPTRLTLLARESRKLRAARARSGKPVNLVAFTPGTSFDKGWRTGKVEERALLFLILDGLLGFDGWQRRSAIQALRVTASVHALEAAIGRMEREIEGEPDQVIVKAFARAARKSGLLNDLRALLADVGRRTTLPEELRFRSYKLIGDALHLLARAGVETLEPDLVIFDEFQRFRLLLDIEQGGESAELAHELFDYPGAKLLLLSATPYKPYTLAEESSTGEDHYSDFRKTLTFLDPDPTWNANVDQKLAEYRQRMVEGEESPEALETLKALLLRVMCRTERPTLGQDGMLLERILTADDMPASDLRGYVTLRHIATAVEAPANIDYWKSAPYFLNFTDGYRLHACLTDALKKAGVAELKPLLDRAQLLSESAMDRYEQVDFGNARLRQLERDTVEQGWWRLLWMPPSLPYYKLGDAFATAAAAGMTKRLVFSSWAATPTAVASLLSYEAERRIVEGQVDERSVKGRSSKAGRLQYRLVEDRPTQSTLALFWPMPGLAAMCDPLRLASTSPDRLLARSDLESIVRQGLSNGHPPQEGTESRTMSGPETALRWRTESADMAPDDAANLLDELDSDEDGEASPDAAVGWGRHVDLARELAADVEELTFDETATSLEDLVAIGLYAPGNVAWRSLGRLLGPDSTVTRRGRWQATLILSEGLRSLFNRFESVVLLERENPDVDYWRAVLNYAAQGGLQSVLDEYVHHLRSELPDEPLDDAGLLRVATAAGKALALRTATYRAFDPMRPTDPIPLRSRFALRYGSRSGDSESARQPEVRGAFNSPFWPFVLATTSAGQEGIDFHWWCSAVVHWNTPSNPVDFEQREGRVHRFGGHAVRRNVAAKHRGDALASSDRDPWRAAYDAAQRSSGDLGEFAPYWVYPGDAKVERHIMPLPLSRDLGRYEQLKSDLAVYRLAFGQPRQEDMLELMRRRGVVGDRARQMLSLRP